MSAAERQHPEAFLRRSVRSHLCPSDEADLSELVELAVDDAIFPAHHFKRQSCSV